MVEAALGLEQLHALQYSAELVLPAAARGEQLFEHERAAANLVFIPCQRAEVAHRAEHRGRKDAARAQSAACGDGRQQRQLHAAAERRELVAERSVALGAEARLESGQHQCRLGYGEGAAHVHEVGKLLIRLHHLNGSKVYAP